MDKEWYDMDEGELSELADRIEAVADASDSPHRVLCAEWAKVILDNDDIEPDSVGADVFSYMLMGVEMRTYKSIANSLGLTFNLEDAEYLLRYADHPELVTSEELSWNPVPSAKRLKDAIQVLNDIMKDTYQDIDDA